MIVSATLVLVLCMVLSVLNLSVSRLWLSPNRYSALAIALTNTLNSVNASLYKYAFTCLIVVLLLLNVVGNIPGFSIPSLFYFYTSSLSVSLWVALMVVVTQTQLKSFIAHMLPFGSPIALILLLPLIEGFSHIIRPLTLMIRLSTNLCSGHIMIYMFSFFALSGLTLTFSLTFVLGILFLLELMISCLQAYIFSSLVIMYISETIYD